MIVHLLAISWKKSAAPYSNFCTSIENDILNEIVDRSSFMILSSLQFFQ